jgi:outer membrane protein
MIGSFKYLSKKIIAKRLAMSFILMSMLAMPAHTAVDDQDETPEGLSNTSAPNATPAESAGDETTPQKAQDTVVAKKKAAPKKAKKKATAKKAKKKTAAQKPKAEPKVEESVDKEPAYEPVAYASAPTGATQTLEQALTAAYDYNSEIKAARATVRAADEAIAKAKSGYRPTLDLTGQADTRTTVNSGTTKNLGQTPSSTAAKSINGGVQANQNIFQGWNTVASVDEAESNRQAALLDLVTLEQRVFTDTVTSYLTLLSLAAEVRLLKASVAVLKEQHNSSQVKFNVGEETRTSVAQAQSKLANYTAQLSSKESQLEAQKAIFTRLTGLTPGALSKPPEFTTIPTVLMEAIEIAMSENPDIQAKKYLADAADHAKTRVSSGLWPKLDLQAGSNYTRADTKNRDVINPSNGFPAALPHTLNNQVVSNVTLNARIPLYEAGAVRADRRQAYETSEQRRVEIETTRRRIAEQLAQLWSTFKSARANLGFYRQQVAANEISLEGTRQEMAVGTKILLDVLNEQSDLIQAQQNLVNAEKDYYISGYQLMAAMGRLTSTHLNLPVQKYDADAHYQETVDRW